MHILVAHHSNQWSISPGIILRYEIPGGWPKSRVLTVILIGCIFIWALVYEIWLSVTGERLKDNAKEDKYEIQGEWEMALAPEISGYFADFLLCYRGWTYWSHIAFCFFSGCILVDLHPVSIFWQTCDIYNVAFTVSSLVDIHSLDRAPVYI